MADEYDSLKISTLRNVVGGRSLPGDQSADGRASERADTDQLLGVSAMTTVQYNFNSYELPNKAGAYLNNIDNTCYVFASRYVKRIGFNVASFATEPSYDYLDVTYDPGAPTFRLTGSSVTLGYRSVTTQFSSQSFQLHPARFDFHTDTSVTSTGFNINQARVCCDSSLTDNIPVNSFAATQRVDGLLLGSSDVVYFWQGVGYSNRRRNMALWGTPGGTPARDFDLYVRCNALPTLSVWDYRGFSSDVNEFLTWQEPGSCTSPGTWYIAVVAYSGSGQFSLVRSEQWSSSFATSRRLRIGTDYNATSAELSTISNTMSQAARILYGMTEGQVLIERIYLYNNVNCANGCAEFSGGKLCEICWKNAGSGCGGTTTQVFCGPNMATSPELMAHELGHTQLKMLDEYQSFGVPHCGHSNLGNPWKGTLFNVCHTGDHNRDGTSGSTSPNGPGWSVLANNSRVPYIYTKTPDNHHYRDHDFNGKIDVVLR